MMGLMDRFKKKDDDLGLDAPLDDFGQPPLGQTPGQGDPFGQPDPFAQQPLHNDPLGMTPDYNNPDLNSVKNIQKPRDLSFNDQYHQQDPISHTSPSSGHMEKDLQIIIAKLDAIKSEMDSLHQRIQKIEKIAEEDRDAAMKKQQYRW